MCELIQAGPRSFYINCPARTGVLKINDTQVCLIDNENDKDAGRKARQILEREGWQLYAIISTRSNADHIGGNRYLQQQTGCKVYAKSAEAALTAYPELEPAFLYGGYPFADLRHKFLTAPGSQVSDMDPLYEDETLRELEIIPLPGHFLQMVGVHTPDGTLLLADCLSNRAALDKYKVSFIYDVALHLGALDKVAIMEAALPVPTHVETTDSIRSLAEYNKQYIHEIAAKLLELCATLRTFEPVLKVAFDYYSLTTNFQQHVLVGSTIRPYLAWLKDTGLLQAYVQDNRIIWSV